MITITQLRAKGLLGWSQSELAARAGLSLPTVKRLEGEFGPRVSDDARKKLQRAVETGVEFIDENGGGPGVRLRKRQKSKRRFPTLRLGRQAQSPCANRRCGS